MNPQEFEWFLTELETWLNDVWQHLTPSQQQAAREAFDRVRAAIAQARLAGPGAAAYAGVRAAMEALIKRLAAIGVRLTIFFQRLIDILGRFIVLFGEGSSGPGAAAGAGLAAAEITAILFALIAVAAAIIIIYREATVEIEDQPDGIPCGTSSKEGREMATVKRSLTVWAFGRRSALKKALREAAKLCAADSGNCKGDCEDGNCKPVMALQEFDLTWFFAATRAKVTFTCPCGCVED